MRSAGAVLAVMVSLVPVGCGGDAGPVALPVTAQEKLPLVLPPSVVGGWVALSRLDEREVVAPRCDGSLLRLDVGAQGALRLTGPGVQAQARATAVEIRPDAAVVLGLAQGGRLVLEDRDEGRLWARGDLAGLDAGETFVAEQDGSIERVLPPAADCGGHLDLAPLRDLDAVWTAGADPCLAPGLALDLGRHPSFRRAGLALSIVAVGGDPTTTWLTVKAADGALQGVRLDRLDADHLRVSQRREGGMSSETLARVEGRCGR